MTTVNDYLEIRDLIQFCKDKVAHLKKERDEIENYQKIIKHLKARAETLAGGLKL